MRQLKNEMGLVVLTIRLGGKRRTSSGGPESIEFAVQRGEEHVVTNSFLPDELGLASEPGWTQRRYWDPLLKPSPHLAGWLHQAVAEVLPPGQPLWLQLGPPTGNLALFPWEPLLHDIFARPILRLPHFALFPKLGLDSLDVVVFTSQPQAKVAFDEAELVVRLAKRVLEDLESYHPEVHLFVDAPAYSELRDGWGQQLRSLGGQVHLYDPPDAPEHSEQTDGSLSDSVGLLSNPWLRWISEKMAGRTVEILHFICHAYLSKDQPALAVGEAPSRNRDRSWARFIGANQISQCLTQLGGWAVGFSSPPLNFSYMGLRLLGDDLSHLRPGPILLHDLGADPEATQLLDAYGALLRHKTPPPLREVAMYSHPRLTPDTNPPRVREASDAETVVEESLGSASQTAGAPAWVQSTRRYLEQSAARLFPEEPSSPEERALAEGVRHALEFVGREISSSVDTESEAGDEEG